MSVVRIEPLGVEIALKPGESVAQAAWRLGYHWPTTCFGQAICMQCRVEVVTGEEFVIEPDEEESEAMLARLPRPLRDRGARLGCRLEVLADGVTVFKRGVRPPEAV